MTLLPDRFASNSSSSANISGVTAPHPRLRRLEFEANLRSPGTESLLMNVIG
jgi:hypothetical protein